MKMKLIMVRAAHAKTSGRFSAVGISQTVSWRKRSRREETRNKCNKVDCNHLNYLIVIILSYHQQIQERGDKKCNSQLPYHQPSYHRIINSNCQLSQELHEEGGFLISFSLQMFEFRNFANAGKTYSCTVEPTLVFASC